MGQILTALNGGEYSNPPRGSVTVPIQRTPVLDGASGLHYSGRVYTNQFQKLSADICNGVNVSIEKVAEVMPNSLSTTSLPIDPNTKRISQSSLDSYVQNLVSTGKVPGKIAKFDDQMSADNSFYNAVQAEYCFYESRYRAALTQFLALVADTHGADQNAISGVLGITVNLNKRLNSLLEILNYVGNDRARNVNDRSPKINSANDILQNKISILEAQKKFLQTSDVRIRTQEEMMRYSSEKSRAMNIQIMFFVALNVVALGTIITVYKSVRPTM
jgi:hypothetical protein